MDQEKGVCTRDTNVQALAVISDTVGILRKPLYITHDLPGITYHVSPWYITVMYVHVVCGCTGTTYVCAICSHHTVAYVHVCGTCTY